MGLTNTNNFKDCKGNYSNVYIGDDRDGANGDSNTIIVVGYCYR